MKRGFVVPDDGMSGRRAVVTDRHRTPSFVGRDLRSALALKKMDHAFAPPDLPESDPP